MYNIGGSSNTVVKTMINKMNKKGATLTIGMVMAIFVAILLFIFLSGGGISTAWDITKFLKSIPAPIWVIFGVIIIFKLIGGKK